MIETFEPQIVGDGFDDEKLLRPREVAEMLDVSYQRLLQLPIPRIRLSSRRIRYRPQAVRDYLLELEKKFA